VLCVVRADRSSRGVLPSVVCLSVTVKPQQRGGRGPLGGGGGLLRHGNKKSYLYCLHIALTLHLYTLNVLTPYSNMIYNWHGLAADGENIVQLQKLP